jgi:hypothetical protein
MDVSWFHGKAIENGGPEQDWRARQAYQSWDTNRIGSAYGEAAILAIGHQSAAGGGRGLLARMMPTLGSISGRPWEIPGANGTRRFRRGLKAAEAWSDQVESGGVRSKKLETVADACRVYLTVRPGAIAEGVFRRQVYGDPIARVKLGKLRRHLTICRLKRPFKTRHVLQERMTGGPPT